MKVILLVMTLLGFSSQVLAGFRPMSLARRPITIVLTSGTSWTVPAGITSLRSVECWGAGGGTAGDSYVSFGGGGGGAYAKKINLAVTPGATITYQLGAGGNSPLNGVGTDGGDTWFVNSSTVLAKGGKGSLKDSTNWLGGAGGAAGSSIGNVVYSGGKGGNTPVETTGAGGGSSATPTGAGTAGADCLTTVGGAGGSATNAGAGGAGGLKSATPTVGGDGVANAKGGGGGGGGGSNTGSAAGAKGGAGGFPGGGAGSHGANNGGIYIGSNNGAGGQIIIIYQK